MLHTEIMTKKTKRSVSNDRDETVDETVEVVTFFRNLPPRSRTKILRLAKMLTIEAEIAESAEREP